MIKRYKKIIAIFLTVCFVSQSFIFLPQKASAAVVTATGAGVPIEATGPTAAALTLITKSTVSVDTKETILDAILYMALRAFIRTLTADIINWINSGFNGNPAFVTSPGQFFTNIADRTIGEYIEGTELGFLCDSFSLDVRLAIGLSYRPFKDKVTCTLSEIVGNVEGGISKFTDGDFAAGGWNSWIELTTSPQNNRYGSYLFAQAEIDSRLAKKLGIEKNKLEWGKGFMSFEKCDSVSDESEDAYYARLDAQGDREKYGPDSEEYSISNAIYNKENNCRIETPGSVIVDQLNFSLGSEQRQAELADEINESISAVAGALINQALKQGLRALSGTGASDKNSEISKFKSRSQHDAQVLLSLRDSVQRELLTRIDDENAYRKMKEDTLADVDRTITPLTNVIACYQGKLGTDNIYFNFANYSEQAEAQVLNATTTITNRLIPLKQSLNADIASSSVAVSALRTYLNKINSSNIDEVEKAVNGYQTFISRSSSHTLGDLGRAQIEKDAIVTEMSTLRAEANTSINTCNALKGRFGIQ